MQQIEEWRARVAANRRTNPQSALLLTQPETDALLDLAEEALRGRESRKLRTVED